jgi:hypothetical protein
MTIQADLVSPDAELESDLIDVINRHIDARNLHPQVASEVLAIMASDVLKALAWLPGNVREADKSLRSAIAHMREG